MHVLHFFFNWGHKTFPICKISTAMPVNNTHILLNGVTLSGDEIPYVTLFFN